MLWLWIACSVKIPDYLLDPYGVAHPQCNESDHLRAVGFDEKNLLLWLSKMREEDWRRAFHHR